MKKLYINILGIILIVNSLIYMIANLNLIECGYSYFTYLNYFECIFLILGIIMLIINNKGGNK
jgi:hypothetical protein